MIAWLPVEQVPLVCVQGVQNKPEYLWLQLAVAMAGDGKNELVSKYSKQLHREREKERGRQSSAELDP